MPLTVADKKRAAELLPSCVTLTDAEKAFGGLWDAEHGTRNYHRAAIAWGLRDGYRDHEHSVAGIQDRYHDDYEDGYLAGSTIRRLEKKT